jgi:hypothetical protein
MEEGVRKAAPSRLGHGLAFFQEESASHLAARLPDIYKGFCTSDSCSLGVIRAHFDRGSWS